MIGLFLTFFSFFFPQIPRCPAIDIPDDKHSATMSDYSASPSDHHSDIHAPKRKATQAGLDGHTTGRSVKRRASKACQCCRARKVRCNVTEHGAPCTNCRLDEVECIVSESRRKKSVSHSVSMRFFQISHRLRPARQLEIVGSDMQCRSEHRHAKSAEVSLPLA